MEQKSFIESDPSHIFALRQLDKFMIDHKGFIAGGCFKNLFNAEHMKDVDVFFASAADFSDAVGKFETSAEYSAAYTSPNVQAYRHEPSGVVVELVRALFGTPEEILKQFDFTVVKFAYFKEEYEDEEAGIKGWQYKAVYHPQFFEHLHLKRLIIDDLIAKPMNTFERVIKYRKYGFAPCTETKQKLIQALRKLPEEEVLVPTKFYEGID